MRGRGRGTAGGGEGGGKDGGFGAPGQLKATWEKPATAPFPSSEELFDYMRTATPPSPANASVAGNPDAAFSGAAKIIEAEYQVPFQGHTAFAGAHATSDTSNAQMTIHS